MKELAVDGEETLDAVLARHADSFGYTCSTKSAGYVDAKTVVALAGDEGTKTVNLPFAFPLYGASYDKATVSINGFVEFTGTDQYSRFYNTAIPNREAPNAAVYAFWDDLLVDSFASVRTQVVGTAPNRRFVIEWRNVQRRDAPNIRVNAEIVLTETGHVVIQYGELKGDQSGHGGSATVGVENAEGTVALQYSYNEPILRTGLAIEYKVPNSAYVRGTVTDANDGKALAGATVSVMRGDTEVRKATTRSDGGYLLQLPLGDYTVKVGARNYVGGKPVDVSLEEAEQFVTADLSLATAVAEANPGKLTIVAPPGQQRTQTVTVKNPGGAPLTWEAKEIGGARNGTAEKQAVLAQTPEKSSTYDPNARTTEGMYVNGATLPSVADLAPQGTGNVIRSWPRVGNNRGWGVGYTGNVWVSDVYSKGNYEYTSDGTPDRHWPASWALGWPADMTYVPGTGMCQVHVSGDKGIYCWDPATGAVVNKITGSFPWTDSSQRGLAYRADDDTFYIGGWEDHTLYHIKGLSSDNPGEVISQCRPAGDAGSISGLAWNAAFGVLWAATNSQSDTIYQLDPGTCGIRGSLPHPTPGFNGAGLEMDDTGNLWTVGQKSNRVYLIDSGLSSFADVPWLSEQPASGTIAPGESQDVRVTVDTTGLEPGIHTATVQLITNAGRQPAVQLPVTVVVSAYQQSVNAGSDGGYTDHAGAVWSADQAYVPGGWGYVYKSKAESTRAPIAGTEDGQIYQTQRVAQDNTMEYRFDGLPDGTYTVEMSFAELQNMKPNERLYDVTLNGQAVLTAHDIAAEVGLNTADNHTFTVQVNGGSATIRFIARQGAKAPVVNALRITERPDLS
ncbi:malectin domain-containing carbohydrate-binding protein [Micromonospora sp. NPDC047548]|uniref:malectin domain-containing carbohydrate-binding protein n=1 Tax=Micromonospora sp. NPDC047548 TaxID=3155624 RepID=UPI00340DA4A9